MMRKRIVESLDDFINEAKEFTADDILKYVKKELSKKDYIKEKTVVDMYDHDTIRAVVYGKFKTAYEGNPYQVEILFVNTKTGTISGEYDGKIYTNFTPGDKKSFIQAWNGAVTWMWNNMSNASRRDIERMAGANLTHDAYR